MTLPRSIIEVELGRLEDLPELGSANRPYAIARVGRSRLGRSRPIPRGATTFDLGAEPMRWVVETADHGAGLEVEVEIWDDRGDAGPTRIARSVTTVSADSPFVLSIGVKPRIEGWVRASPLPKPSPVKIFGQRVPAGTTRRTRVRQLHEAAVRLVEIAGLYKPGHRKDGSDTHHAAEYSPGYTSSDHAGRIYINRDLQGHWTKHRQQIRLTVDVLPLRGRLPTDAKVVWTVTVPDDPINDDEHTHREAGPVLDEKDYDGSGYPTGASGNDNEGVVHMPPGAESTAPWEEVAGFAISGSDETEARTEITHGRSSIVLHCPSTNGDRLLVRATVEGTGLVGYPASTGTMTMWRRLDVEHIQMKSARRLPLDEVRVFFEPYCVQLDLTTRVIGGHADRPFLTTNFSKRHDACQAYLRQHSQHIGQAGWFCLVVGRRLVRAGPSLERHGPVPGQIVQDRESDIVRVPGAYGSVRGVLLTYTDVEGQPHRVQFAVSRTERRRFDPVSGADARVFTADKTTHTMIWIEPHSVTSRFTHGDGSEPHAHRQQRYYYPQREGDDTDWFPNRRGYGIPDDVEVTIVEGLGGGNTVGISPPRYYSGAEYFCGRTMAFTDNDYGKAYMLATIVHELLHAFGMPHICGHHDYRAPRMHECVMNYEWIGLVNDDDEIISDDAKNTGPWPCALHLREVRRTKLEDNPALGWG